MIVGYYIVFVRALSRFLSISPSFPTFLLHFFSLLRTLSPVVIASPSQSEGRGNLMPSTAPPRLLRHYRASQRRKRRCHCEHLKGAWQSPRKQRDCGACSEHSEESRSEFASASPRNFTRNDNSMSFELWVTSCELRVHSNCGDHRVISGATLKSLSSVAMWFIPFLSIIAR